jgi:hypothetical protein
VQTSKPSPPEEEETFLPNARRKWPDWAKSETRSEEASEATTVPSAATATP